MFQLHDRIQIFSHVEYPSVLFSMAAAQLSDTIDRKFDMLISIVSTIGLRKISVWFKFQMKIAGLTSISEEYVLPN